MAVTGYLIVCAVMAVWGVGAASIAGLWLRVAQFDIVRCRSFVLVRRYGLAKGSIRALFRVAKAPNLLWRRKTGTALVTVISVPLIGFLAADLLFLLAEMIFGGRLDSRVQAGVGSAFRFWAVAGIVASLYQWCRGLDFIGRPHVVRRGRLGPLPMPASLPRPVRDRLALDAFWLEQVRTATFLGGFYPLSTLVFMQTVDGQPPGTPPGEPVSSLLVTFALVIAMMPAMVPALMTGKRVHRKLAAVEATVLLCRMQTTRPSAAEPHLPSFLPDPDRDRRSDLMKLSSLLDEAAAQLDARQPLGFTPHPNATLLRGLSAKVRGFLQSRDSLDEQPAGDLAEGLRFGLKLLAGADTQTDRKALDELVGAFDQVGRPSVELYVKPPGRLSRWYARTTSSIVRTAALLAAVAGIAVPMLALGLVVAGRMSIADFIGQIK